MPAENRGDVLEGRDKGMVPTKYLGTAWVEQEGKEKREWEQDDDVSFLQSEQANAPFPHLLHDTNIYRDLRDEIPD